MQISEISNKEEFSTIIISELKDIGVKYRKEKKTKIVQDKGRKRIFRTHLHLLELTHVILANGSVVQIPKFVADACNRILEHVGCEGIFRKAGSSIRQKEIRISLEAGLPLGKSHHVIDVANVVKYFFRELPEPLIPPSLQETLLRSLLIGENHVKAILLTCLLLPSLTINTLSFFMQFLYTVSLNAHLNKMSIENLAIIFTPGLMPFPNITSHRFTNHVKMVQLLIENANSIGTIPDSIVGKLQISEVVASKTLSKSVDALEVTQQKKKKKRRSEMFNGLRKIVGSAIGSSENLENTPESKPAAAAAAASSTATSTTACSTNALAVDQRQQQQQQQSLAATPCLKSSKKRKFADPVCAFSAKKKRDLLALLPSNSGGLLPNTPMTKESKKSRLSLGGSRHIKNIAINPVVTSMERRWSIVGTGWAKQKNKNSNETKSHIQSSDITFIAETTDKNLTPIISKCDVPIVEYPAVKADCSEPLTDTTADATDGRRLSKNEYEDIEKRITAIETRISQEFNMLVGRRVSYSSIDPTDLEDINGPERIQHKYEQMVVETEALSSPATEYLTQRLSRGLHIRRSADQRIIRSPSARKIGTMRRRSQEKIRLSRNPTWHISTQSISITPPSSSSYQQIVAAKVPAMQSFYSKSNLKRGRPNTLHTGLIQQQFTPVATDTPVKMELSVDREIGQHEHWTSAEIFFNDAPQPHTDFNSKNTNLDFLHMENKCIKQEVASVDIEFTPVKQCSKSGDMTKDNMKTPMLPPKSVPRRHCTTKTPSSAIKLPSNSKLAASGSRQMVSTPIDEELTGRASIARLRAQNAGMVMAKAKLFDGLGEMPQPSINISASINVSGDSNRRKSGRFTPAIATKTSRLAEKQKVTFKECDKNSSIESAKMDILKSPSINRRKNIAKSPGSIKKRQRTPLTMKCSYKEMLDTVVTQENLAQTCDMKHISRNVKNILKESSKTTTSPRTPKSRHYHWNVNSPRRVRNQTNTMEAHLVNTPTKRNTPVSYRNSPRFTKSKYDRNFAV